MTLTFQDFSGAFLDKVTELDFSSLADEARDEIVKGYMLRSISQFNRICEYDMFDYSEDTETFNADIPDDETEEILDIVSEGMVVQWLKPYIYHTEMLENAMYTEDFRMYSPAELLKQVSSAYKSAKKDFKTMCHNYSYTHGDLTDLHL